MLLTLFAMLRPTLVYTKVEPQQASLVLLVDGSRSMQVADSLGDKSRWDAMKLLLDAAAGDLAKLDETWDVTAYQFDADDAQARRSRRQDRARGRARRRAIGHRRGDQRCARPRDERPRAGDAALERRRAAGGAAARSCRRRWPPAGWRPRTFRSTRSRSARSGGSERADLAIDDLVTNETIFTETPTEVRGQLTAEGYANQRVKVQLLWETAGRMEVVDTVQVDTGVEGGSVPVALQHTPRTPGEYKVTLRVEPREGELVTTNNEVSTFVTVRAGGINVLYLVGAKRIGGGPGPEQRFVRAALAQSPDIVVERRLINYDPPGVDLVEAIRDGESDVVHRSTT